MTKVGPWEHFFSFQAKQKFSRKQELGTAIVGINELGDLDIRSGVYQGRPTSKGRITVRMKYYRPTNPQTVAQQANRAKYTDAVLAWQNLTDEQKTFYNKEGLKRRKRGYDYFRSLHLKGEI